MSSPPRRNWLDWQRGLAVLCMIEVHALDAWLSPAEPRSSIHTALWMLGGMAAPGFLYMAGLAQSLTLAAQARRGIPPRARLTTALRRALVVVAAAYGFRLLEYVLGGAWLVSGGWRDLFRVDVLNVIGVGLVLSALLAALPARVRAAAFVAAAALVALATPPIAAWSGGPSWLAPWSFARAPGASFALFPWLAFLFGGCAAGELLSASDRPVATIALGAALYAAGLAGDLLPTVYTHQDFWHASPAWTAMRLGIAVAASGALQLLPPAAPLRLLRALGRHSLLAYVASVELTYGFTARPLRRALGTGGVLLGAAALALLAWWAAELLDRRTARRRLPPPEAPVTPTAAAA